MDNNVSAIKPKTVTPVTVLVLGIVAAALSYNGVPIAGIIVGCIAAKKVKTYLEENNGVTGTMVMVGSILSKVGIYLGIGITALVTLYFVFYIGYFTIVIGFIGQFFSEMFEVLSKHTGFFISFPF